MLLVPELKPGEKPYEPGIVDNVGEGSFFFHSPGAETGETDVTYEEILSHALVKDAVTLLHREDDERFAELRKCDGHALSTMVRDHEAYLANKKNAVKNTFADDRQKQLFVAMTEPYFRWSADRVRLLYGQKVEAYRREVVDRQNAELTERMLRPENLFDDNMQTLYRDMVLFNLESAYAGIPEKERRERLDQASGDIYRRIIEKRLEADPGRVASILDAKAVQRVLPAEALVRYRELTAKALQDVEWDKLIAEWLREDADDETVRAAIRKSAGTGEAADELTSRYGSARTQKDRKRCLETLLNCISVWDLVKDGGAIPAWVKRTDPELHAYLLDQLALRERLGGSPPPVDYMAVLRFVDEYVPARTMRHLSEAKNIYTLLNLAGGGDSPAFGVMLRLMLGVLDANDNAWLRDMRLCRDMLVRRQGAEPLPEPENSVFRRFDTIRSLRIKAKPESEPDELEIRAVLKELLAEL